LNLSEAQEASEARGLSDGERRYVRRVARAYESNAATGAPSVRHFMECILEWLAADLRVKIGELLAQPGPMPLWAEWVQKIGPDKTAYLTCKSALNGIALHTASVNAALLTHVCLSLMRAMADEQRAEVYLEADSAGLANALQHRAHTKLARSLRVIHTARSRGVVLPKSPGAKEAINVGSHLLMALCQSTGAFTIETVRDYHTRKHRSHLVLVPHEATLQWIATRSDRLRLTYPLHPPLLIPPKDWGQGIAGGYHNSLAGCLPLVRNGTASQSAKIAAEPMPLVYAALNALQRTSWRVNGRVLEIVKLALDGKIPDLIPSSSDTPLPPRPLTEDPAILAAWRRQTADIYDANDRRRTKRADAERSVVVADQVRTDERFYYPYSLDFRGRAYPAVEFLNPHGPDVVRGMLEFADGVAISKVGAGWLAVHGANTLGISDGRSLTKLSFQERVDVVRGLSDRISQAAADPIGSSHLWATADDPWQFLAFCFEWAEWLKTGVLETHLPVGLDGTANGLQHFSAMLRDPVAAAAVNMTNTNRPADLYAVVSEAVLDILGQNAGTDKIAALWLSSGLVNRSLVKRPVMTLAYGATRYGFVDQILSYLRNEEDIWTIARRIFSQAHIRIRVGVQYLSSVLWTVLGSTVAGALQAMGWLQASALSVVAATGGIVSWSVPMTGFPAHMEYWKSRRAQIHTLMSGTILAPTVWTATTNPDMRRVRNSISPNVVHSADASAMCATTVACAARGVPSFSMIHDSYAVHAEFVPTLADALRTSFIDLYQDRDFLMDLATQWRALGAEIADPPLMGSFNIEDVRQSRYFFN